MAEHMAPAVHKSPDYELPDTFALDRSEQFTALFEDTRMQIADLVLERAATIKELAEVLEKPKGTIGHHVGVLENAGLIRVVRTKKIRAMEAKYYGRTARTFLLGTGTKTGFEFAPNHFLTTAAEEFASSAQSHPQEDHPYLSTLRYARVPAARAAEWNQRLVELSQEFASEEREGDTTYGLLVAFYPTDRPHLPHGGELR